MKNTLLFSLILLSGCTSSAYSELHCPVSKAKKSPQQSRFSDFSHINDWGHHFSYTHSARIISDPIDPDNKVLRMEIRQGDTYRTYTGDRHRAEVYETYKAVFNQPIHYSFRVYVPEEWQFADVRSLIAQWHATPDKHLGEISRSPNLGIELHNNRFLIRGQTSNEVVNTHNKQGMHRYKYYESEPIKRNHWYKFDIFANWSHEDNGALIILIDDQEIVNFSGATSYYDCVGPYFKMGVYRDDTPETFVIYLDDYQRNLM